MMWTEEKDGQYVPVQWDLRDDPWKVLVSCVVLRRTGGHLAKPVLEKLFDRWPTCDALCEELGNKRKHQEVVSELRTMLVPCGLYRLKAYTIAQMSTRWRQLRDVCFPETPSDYLVGMLDGVGEYALDSYRIFVLGKYVADPSDHVLAAWEHSPMGRDQLNLDDHIDHEVGGKVINLMEALKRCLAKEGE